MANIIAIPQPDHFEASERNQRYGFGYYNARGDRDHMEDSLAWQTLSNSELSPEEIDYRLWTSYQLLDQEILAEGLESGCTASTTVYDGRGHFITATIADAACFAIVYDQLKKFKRGYRQLVTNFLTKFIFGRFINKSTVNGHGGYCMHGFIAVVISCLHHFILIRKRSTHEWRIIRI